MDYIEICLPFTNLRPGQDPYPDRTRHDIVEAVYHDQFLEKGNPDVCALPPRIPDQEFLKKCVKGFPGYNREAVNKMKLSERLLALDALKDYVRVYLPYYVDFSRRLLSCLLSAYRGRAFAVGKDHFRTKNDGEVDPYTLNNIAENQVLSVAPIIATNVQCLALVGLAGTGKSTCLELVLSFFPHAIRHNLPNGYKYLQIPFLQISAVKISDTKAFFISLAAQIDLYIGHGSIYRSLMVKKQNISKMLEYFDELSRQFHIGIIVIDEIQMITDKNLFNHLLSLSNSAHVSICLIGTETAMDFLHKDSWAMRRFGELGYIKAGFGTQERQAMESIVRQIWKYQFTYTYTEQNEPDEDSIQLLVNASMGNIDLLTTLFVKAQRIALRSKNKTTCLTPEIISRAVSSIQKAQNLLRDEKKVIEAYASKEKEELQVQLRTDIGVEKAREATAMQKAAEQEFRARTDILDDLVFRIGNVADYSIQKIEKAYDRLTDSGLDLLAIDPRQRAKMVLAALQDEEMQAQQKKRKKKTDVKTKDTQINKKKSPAASKTGIEDVIAGGIDDLTNFSTHIS